MSKKNTFDQKEFNDFMKINDFDFLIRSKTVCPNGFRLDFDNRCITVYSSSNTRNANNEPAVAMIDDTDLSIRFIRFESAHPTPNTI